MRDIKKIFIERVLLITKHIRNLYKHKRAFDITIIVLLLSLIFISRFPMLSATTSKVWWNLDDSEYISVANNLSHGHGFNLGFLDHNEVITNTPNGAVYQYSLYDTIGRAYYFAGPIYPLFLAGIFIISSASPSNWVTVSAIANMVVTMFVVVAVFVLARKLFDRNVAILSSTATVLLPSLFWYSMRPLPYPLFFLFIVLAFITANRASGPKWWLLVGLLAALAHLTHGSGILVIATFFVWCLVSKRFKESLFLTTGYIILMLPWMLRNQLLLGDFGLGLSIPGRAILGLFGMAGSSPDILSNALLTNSSRSSFNLLTLLLYIPNELSRLYSMLILVILIVVFSTLGFFIYKKRTILLPQFIFLAFSIVGYIYLGFVLNSETVETKYLMPSFLLLIPLSMYGFSRLIFFISSKLKNRLKTVLRIAMVLVLFMIISISLVTFSINLNTNFNLPMAETSEEAQFHAWVREQNLPPQTIILTNAPHVLFLRTGLNSLYLDSDNANSTQIEWLIDRYAVNYIVLYHYSSIGGDALMQFNKTLRDRNITEVYSSEEIRFYNLTAKVN